VINEDQGQNGYTPRDDERLQDIMDMVSHQVNSILEYSYMKKQQGEEPEDPFEAVYDAMSQSIASEIILYSALRHLEERLGRVT